MNVKTTVILVVLLILCTGYVIVFHTGWFGPGTEKSKTPEAAGRLLFPEVGRLQRVVLQRPGAKRIVLVRKDEKWRLVEPVDAPATGWRADSLVTTLTSLTYLAKYAPDEPDCPKDNLTSLTDPLHTVTFTTDKDRTYVLKVGRKPPLRSRQTYVQVKGDPHVYVVRGDLDESFGKSVWDFRDKSVAKFDVDKAVRVEIRGDVFYRLVKVDGKWALDKPVPARADQKKVKTLLRDISDLTVSKFVEASPAGLGPYGLDAPRLAITVQLAPPKPAKSATTAPSQPATRPKPRKGRVIRLLFGAADEENVFAKLADSPEVFQFKRSDVKDLQPKLADLRDKRVMDLGEREITRLEIHLVAGTSATLEKVAEQWRMLRPFAGRCEQASVEELLKTLKDLQASEFRDNPATFAAFGLKPPKGRIVMHFRGSAETKTLELGRASDSGQMGFVRPAGGKSVAVVPANQYTKLLRPAAAYWSKTIFALPDKAEVVRLELSRPDGSFCLRRRADEKYELVRPVRADADADNVKNVLEALRSVKAGKVIALGKTLPKRFAKGKPIRVTLTYRLPVPTSAPASRPTSAPAATTQPTTVAATQPTTSPASQPVRYSEHRAGPLLVIQQGDKSYVWVEGATPLAVGELDKGFHDKLAAEMRDRTVLRLDPDKAVSFTLRLEKTSLRFRRSGDVWRYESDPFVKIDAQKIREFFTELAKIKAQRFVSYRAKPDLRRFGLDRPAMSLSVTSETGRTVRLNIARTGPIGTPGMYASSSEVPGVFILAPEAGTKIKKSLGDFQKKP